MHTRTTEELTVGRRPRHGRHGRPESEDDSLTHADATGRADARGEIGRALGVPAAAHHGDATPGGIAPNGTAPSGTAPSEIPDTRRPADPNAGPGPLSGPDGTAHDDTAHDGVAPGTAADGKIMDARHPAGSGASAEPLSSADAALGSESQAGFEIVAGAGGTDTAPPAPAARRAAPSQPGADHSVSPAPAAPAVTAPPPRPATPSTSPEFSTPPTAPMPVPALPAPASGPERSPLATSGPERSPAAASGPERPPAGSERAPAAASGPERPPAGSERPPVAAPRERMTWLTPSGTWPGADAEWPPPQMRLGRPAAAGAATPPQRPGTRLPRNPATGLPLLVVLALLTAFFAWVSAEPLWLAVGHGTPGTATITHCSGPTLAQRCTGTFTGARFTTEDVAVLGVPSESRAAGSRLPARMVDEKATRAHASFHGLGLHLRWSLGLALVFLCGFGIAWATGATRLETRRSRTQAVMISIGAPLTLLLGFLIAAW